MSKHKHGILCYKSKTGKITPLVMQGRDAEVLMMMLLGNMIATSELSEIPKNPKQYHRRCGVLGKELVDHFLAGSFRPVIIQKAS